MNRYARCWLSTIVMVFSATLCCLAAGPDSIATAARGPEAGGQASQFTGLVVESMPKGNYTFVRMDRDGKSLWVALPPAIITVGQPLTVIGCRPMTDPAVLARNPIFGKILFCKAPSFPAEAELMRKGSRGSQAAVPGALLMEPIKKLKGETVQTVHHCYLNCAVLENRPVTVRGKVVKVSASILGRNWIHLQDGTGIVARKTHNLVVTSSDMPKVGEVVTMTGILARDRDFGHGYTYRVLVEQATLQR